jgi:hypothetical protein
MRPVAPLLSILALALLTGCLELGQIGDPGDYSNAATDMAGEVQYVDTSNRQIEIRTDAGRTWNVRYDNQTRVVYRQRDYAVSNLEPGDYVAIRTQQDRDGRLYTDLVTVRESVQDRGGASRGSANRLDKVEGTVEHIDSRRGQFEVRDRSNRVIVVALPYNAPRSVSDRFNRLREGDAVRIEGRFVNQERFELENFL